jgi:PLP dependent protein
MDEHNPYGHDELLERLEGVRRRVAQACSRAGRSTDEVCLIAVSKTHPTEALRVLYDAGVRDFGESYVQEWLDKAAQLPADIRWHFIGRLQSNKARFVAESNAVMVHSVDRMSLAKPLAGRSERIVDVLIQVNLAEEETKGGVSEKDLNDFFDKLTSLESLRVRGLMTMPPYADDPEASRGYFSRLKVLLESLRRHSEGRGFDAGQLDVLSMGMTNDFEVAIEEGATHIRVGTALFGERSTA